MQLRTGHIPLNAYLHRFKETDSARCPACGHHEETSQRYLLDCPGYAHERWTLAKRCRRKELRFADILTSNKTIGPLCAYIESTGRFELVQQEQKPQREETRQLQAKHQTTPRLGGPIGSIKT